MELRREVLEKRFSGLKEEYDRYVPVWRELRDFVSPLRGFFYGDDPKVARRINSKTYLDDVTLEAAKVLAAGMQSGLTSKSLPWFELTLEDPDLNDYGGVREWLELVADRMRLVLAKSNMYDVFHNSYEEQAPFGTACYGLFDDYDDVIRGRSFTCGEYMLGVSATGRVNLFGRRFAMSVEQMVEQFGLDNVSKSVKNMWDEHKLHTTVYVRHVIEPNDQRLPGLLDSRNMAYRSVYWEEAQTEDKFLRVSGFESFPIVGARWNTVTTLQPYGVGPGHQILSKAEMVQSLHRDKMAGLKYAIKPPLNVPAELQRNGGVNLVPGGINYINNPDGRNVITPVYQAQVPLQDIRYEINELKNEVRSAFYVDMFLLSARSSDTQRTAREIAEKHEEKLLQLGPVIERQESDSLTPVIQRTFQMMIKRGLFPPPPEELENVEINVEYTSILAQAQRMVGVTAIEQFAGFIGGIGQTYPEVLDKFDYDKAADRYAAAVGVPKEIVRDGNEVDQLRQSRAEQQMQQQQMMQAGQLVEGAKGLSQIDTGKNNALSALVNGMAGGVGLPDGL